MSIPTSHSVPSPADDDTLAPDPVVSSFLKAETFAEPPAALRDRVLHAFEAHFEQNPVESSLEALDDDSEAEVWKTATPWMTAQPSPWLRAAPYAFGFGIGALTLAGSLLWWNASLPAQVVMVEFPRPSTVLPDPMSVPTPAPATKPAGSGAFPKAHSAGNPAALPKPESPNYRSEGNPAPLATASPADVKFFAGQLTLSVDGVEVTQTRSPAAGSAIRVSLGGNGDYILMLAPKNDTFKPNGWVVGNQFWFEVNGQTIEIQCSEPVVSGSGQYQLWVSTISTTSAEATGFSVRLYASLDAAQRQSP
jgi:hypothetical protein